MVSKSPYNTRLICSNIQFTPIGIYKRGNLKGLLFNIKVKILKTVFRCSYGWYAGSESSELLLKRWVYYVLSSPFNIKVLHILSDLKASVLKFIQQFKRVIWTVISVEDSNWCSDSSLCPSHLNIKWRVGAYNSDFVISNSLVRVDFSDRKKNFLMLYRHIQMRRCYALNISEKWRKWGNRKLLSIYFRLGNMDENTESSNKTSYLGKYLTYRFQRWTIITEAVKQFVSIFRWKNQTTVYLSLENI